MPWLFVPHHRAFAAVSNKDQPPGKQRSMRVAEPRELSCPLPANTSTVGLQDITAALERGLTEGACSQKQEETAINQVLKLLSLGFQERPGFPGEQATEEKRRQGFLEPGQQFLKNKALLQTSGHVGGSTLPSFCCERPTSQSSVTEA